MVIYTDARDGHICEDHYRLTLVICRVIRIVWVGVGILWFSAANVRRYPDQCLVWS